MIHRSNPAPHRAVLAALTLAVLALLVAASPAAAQSPDWPANGHRYNCNYTLAGGASGTAVVEFVQLWATAHVFPDGNQLKRGRLKQYLPTLSSPSTTLDQAVDLAWKPNELPDPPNGSRFELTIPSVGVQCKNFVKAFNYYYGIPTYLFDQCSNGTVMTCSLCGVAGYWNACP